MSDPQPPPLPTRPASTPEAYSPPQPPPPLPSRVLDYGSPTTGDPASPYQTVADTVGFVPSLRWRDNLYQGAAGVAGAVVGMVVFPILLRRTPATMQAALFLGGILGFIVGVVVFGVALGVLRLIGALRHRRRG